MPTSLLVSIEIMVYLSSDFVCCFGRNCPVGIEGGMAMMGCVTALNHLQHYREKEEAIYVSIMGDRTNRKEIIEYDVPYFLF